MTTLADHAISMDDIRRACSLACEKSREYPKRRVSVYLMRLIAVPGRWLAVGLRFGCRSEQYDSGGYRFVLHRMFEGGVEVVPGLTE